VLKFQPPTHKALNLVYFAKTCSYQALFLVRGLGLKLGLNSRNFVKRATRAIQFRWFDENLNQSLKLIYIKTSHYYKVVYHMQNLTELVRQVVEVCLNVRNGENIWIHSWDHTVDLASEIAFACQQHGAHPFITLVTEDYWMRSLLETPKKFLETLPSHQAAALQETNAFIFMLGPRRPIQWDKIPNEKRELANVWYFDSNKYLESWRKIAQEHSVRMLGIEYCLVTKERAQALGLEYTQWKEVMLTGCIVNQQEIAEKAVQLANIIQEGHEVSVQTPFGTNLKFKLVGRKPIVGDSIVSKKDSAQGVVKFLPSGFVEVAADEDSAEEQLFMMYPFQLAEPKRLRD